MIGRLAILALVLAAVGCNDGPRKANIELRKQVADLEQRNTELERHIGALQAPTRTPATMPDPLPPQVVVTTGLLFGKLTAIENGVLKVYIVPTDKFGDEIKAAGTFTVELYDLDREQPRVQQWTVDADEALGQWVNMLTIYGYVIELPLTEPVDGELTVRVAFEETLTGRTFTEQHEIVTD
ncbi:MAG: hypothetical protein AAGD32_14695 [Planctomycetota bacterium]